MKLSSFRITRLLVVTVSLLSSQHLIAEEEVILVSMVNLIERPAEFNKHIVSVRGYLAKHIGFYLFLTEDHATIRDYESAITVAEPDEVNLEDSTCLNQYVELTGQVLKESANIFYIVASEVKDPITNDSCV